jgi:hypothetical protein
VLAITASAEVTIEDAIIAATACLIAVTIVAATKSFGSCVITIAAALIDSKLVA